MTMPPSMDSMNTDSRTFVNDKTMSSTVTPLPSSILNPEDIERAHPIVSAPCPSTEPPFSKKFMAKGDPEVARARAIYLKSYISGLGMVILTIFVVFSIYWGSLWRSPVRSLQGWIVDFDGGEVGQEVVQGLLGDSKVWIITWNVIPAERFPTGVQGVVDALKDDRTWVAVTINPGSSSALQNAVTSPNAAYDGTSAVTAYAAEARNENAYRTMIRPVLQNTLDHVKNQYALKFVTRLANVTSPPEVVNLLSTAPQTLISPISYTLANVLPFNQPVATAVVFVGLIYMLILSFFIVMVAYGAREASGINRILGLRSLIVVRLISSILGYFFLSFFYSLLNLAFKLNVWNKYGHAGFFIFWMLNWIGMLSVGMALESLVTVLTGRFIPFFMILWIIVDVSVCVSPIDVLPRIYHYGYAAPFYNISRSIRSVVFGTRNTLGLNFAVLFAWVVISCTTLPILQWYVRRKEEKKARETMIAKALEK